MGDLVRTDENLNPIGEFRTNDWNGDTSRLISELLFSNPLTDGFSIVRKSFYKKIGLYDPKFKRCNDWEWASRAAKYANIGHVNRFVGFWRKHSNSVTETALAKNDFKFDEMVQKLHVQRYNVNDLLSTINFNFLDKIKLSRDIFVWGCGRIGLITYYILLKKNILPKGWVTNTLNNPPQLPNSNNIYLHSDLEQLTKKPFLIIANSFPDKIIPILNNLEFKINEDYFFAHRLCEKSNLHRTHYW